jgi:hypothetical protein
MRAAADKGDSECFIIAGLIGGKSSTVLFSVVSHEKIASAEICEKKKSQAPGASSEKRTNAKK